MIRNTCFAPQTFIRITGTVNIGSKGLFVSLCSATLKYIWVHTPARLHYDILIRPNRTGGEASAHGIIPLYQVGSTWTHVGQVPPDRCQNLDIGGGSPLPDAVTFPSID